MSLMASGHGQACLITSFFKSPPKEEEVTGYDNGTDQSDTFVSNGKETSTLVSSSGPPAPTAICECDQSDSSSSLESDGDHSDGCGAPGRQGKSLVVNLSGLLMISPEAMETGRPLKRLKLKKKKQLKSKPQRSFTDNPPPLLQTAPQSSPKPSGEPEITSLCVGGNRCQEMPAYVNTMSVLDDHLQIDNETVGMQGVANADPPSQNGNPNLLPGLQKVPCIENLTPDEQSVASQADNTTASGVSPGTPPAGALKQSTLAWNCQSGLLVLRAQTDPSTLRQGRQQQPQQESKQQQQCIEEEPSTASLQVCASFPGASEPPQMNNSFEEFKESGRDRQKKRRRSAKKIKKEEMAKDPRTAEVSRPPATRTPENEETPSPRQPASKRPRRAAAIEAREKCLQRPRRRSTRRETNLPLQNEEEEEEGKGGLGMQEEKRVEPTSMSVGERLRLASQQLELEESTGKRLKSTGKRSKSTGQGSKSTGQGSKSKSGHQVARFCGRATDSEAVVVNSGGSDAEADSSVIVVSSVPPTNSSRKLPSTKKSSNAEVVVSLPLPASSSSAVLSSEWAKIFGKTVDSCKKTLGGSAEVIELCSTATEDETALELSPKRQRKKHRKRNLSHSPLRKYRSRSSSPRSASRPGSPGSRSPLRHPSPLRISSPRRKASLQQSPLKASLSSKRQLPFAQHESRKTASRQHCDSAPFAGLVHVQQRGKDEEIWDLPTPNSVQVLRGRGDCGRMEVRHNVGGTALYAGHQPLGLCDFNDHVGSKSLEETDALRHTKVGSETEKEFLLSRLQEAHPGERVAAIFDRYRRILREKGEGERGEGTGRKDTLGGSNKSYPRSEAGERRRRESVARGQKVKGASQSMKVSIRMCVCDEGDKDQERIRVDSTAYERRSLRLSRTRNPNSNQATHSGIPKEPTRKSDLKTSPPSVTPSSTPSPSPAFQSQLWTEIYRPRCSSEVIGNRTHVEKLLAWLAAWKVKCSNQNPSQNGGSPGAIPARKGEATRGSKTPAADRSAKVSTSEKTDRLPPTSDVPWWARDVDDSDFVSIAHLRRKRVVPRCLDSSDDGGSEGEGSPCPVMLLCGDHGSGKTAAVYACASELGYKVFEVNSTTVRSRQNILSTLREATLSHQVATRPKNETRDEGGGGGGITSFFSRTSNASAVNVGSKSKSEVVKQTKPPQAMTGGLYSFFQPKSKAKENADKEEGGKRRRSKGKGKDSSTVKMEEETAQEVKPSRKRRKRRKSSAVVVDSSSEEEEDTQAPPTASGHARRVERSDSGANSSVTLATATVILLEEVDVLFEEERGFWSAVYEIIETTKRPIIMTCSDHRYELFCDHEKLMFTQPSSDELSLHMQLLSFVHGGHLTTQTANQIAVFLNCDIRRVFNCLQFWLSVLKQDNNIPSPSTPRGETTPPIPIPLSDREAPSPRERPQDISSLLNLDQLLGITDQGWTPERLEGLQLAGLGVRRPITALGRYLESVQTSTVSTERPLDCCEAASHFSTPWRYLAAKKSLSCRYHSLDVMSSLCDDFSYMDTVARETCTHTPNHAPWWNCRPQTGLSDELATVVPCGTAALSSQGMVATMEALMRESVRKEMSRGESSSSRECGAGGDIYGLMEQVKRKRRVEALHTSYLQCSEAFDILWEPSHSAMTMDCLPALKVICSTENVRQEAHTKRRFRHYLQASVVDLSLLKSFPRTASFLGEPSSSDHRPP